MGENIKFKFLKDIPLGNNQDGVFGFYHGNVAPAMKEILENDSCVHTIGLFSKWGTGKSTIIEMIRNDLNSPMFVFDTWKYQEDSLRRIFLIELVNFLIKQKQLLPEDKRLLDPLYKSTEDHQEVINEEKEIKLSWFQALRKAANDNWPFSLAISLILIGTSVSLIFTSKNVFVQAVKDVLTFVASISVLAVFFKPFFEKIWERSVERFLSSLNPLASIKTRVEKEDRLNSPEQFESLFKLILQKIDKRIVIVFDNIDRVQGDAAIKILSAIKTFLDPNGINGLVFIVPCDSEAIITQIKIFYGGQDDKNFDPSEYLRKLFNVVVWTPEFIEADLQAYIKKLIEDSGDIKDSLQNEDVITVISAAFSNNPREIKQFVNNLIAALILASRTEVWDRIKGNVAYLAKVLVLRQKYTAAYLKLREKWFEPENIVQGNDPEELRNFMLNTSRITVTNAQPFIYFKEPIIYHSLSNSEGLILALAEGNEEKFKELVSVESNKDQLFNFIQHLLREYKAQKDILLKIFNTHLKVFNELNIITSTKNYYESLARVLDVDLWQFFDQLPTNLIFSNLLSKQELDEQFRKPIIQRYALVIGAEELRKSDKMQLIKDILSNLKQNVALVSKEDRDRIARFIEEHFSTNSEVVSIFETYEEQNIFLTSQSFDKFIGSIDTKSLASSTKIIVQFKEFITKKSRFDIILQKITELINKETTEFPDYRPEKETLLQACNEIFSHFQEQFRTAGDEIKVQLSSEFMRAFNSISDWDNRSIIINSLRWINLYVPEAQRNETRDCIVNFFSAASAQKIEIVFNYWKKASVERFITAFFPNLLSRSVQDDGVLGMLYQKANKEQKLEIIQNIIQQKGITALNFIRGLQDDLPDRQAVVRFLLNKLPSLPFNEQVLIYDYLQTKLSINDAVDLKDQVINQIKTLLKSDDPAYQEAGFKLIIDADFLGDEKKRDIGKEVLDWLRQPGKVITSAHNFSLKVLVSLVKIMQETPVNDFVYTLFDILRQDRDRDTIQMSLSMLSDIKVSYAAYEKDFKDLLARLKDWPENETKSLVINQIQRLKSSNSKKEEKDFWKDIESLISRPSEE